MFWARAKSFTVARGRELATNDKARALLLSLIAHFIVISGVELGRSMGLWRLSFLAQSTESDPARAAEEAERKERENSPTPPPVTPEAELVFIEVDPAQAVPEPAEQPKFYSTQNTLAANPDTSLDLKVAQVDGSQEKIPKTVDTLRPDPTPPPEPAPEPPKQPKQAEPKPSPKPEPVPKAEPAPPRPPVRPVEEEKAPVPQQPGETLLARAAPRPQPRPPAQPEPAAPQPRPRTVAEAKIRKGILEGPRMKQAGGVRRHSLATSLDVKATPFGSYDQAFILAVQARWFNLLEEREYVGSQSGRVVLEFRLTQDGRITEMRVVASEVSEILSWFCQRAVLDPAPYRPFPIDLRRLMKTDYREIRFTFYYNQ